MDLLKRIFAAAALTLTTACTSYQGAKVVDHKPQLEWTCPPNSQPLRNQFGNVVCREVIPQRGNVDWNVNIGVVLPGHGYYHGHPRYGRQRYYYDHGY